MSSNCAKLTTTNWKWTEIFCQLRKRYYQKKYCSKTFNDIKNSMRRKLQPEGLDAAQFWCYWKFFEFSTNICHSPASWNHTKTEKSYREMSKICFPQHQILSLSSLSLLPLEILWVFNKYLSQPCFPESHENREMSKICFPQHKILSLLSLPSEILWFSTNICHGPASWKKSRKKRKSYRAVKCIFCPMPKIRQTFKLNILIWFAY